MPENRAQKDDQSHPAGRTLDGRSLLTNRPEDIGALRDKLLAAIEASGYPEAAAFAIRLAFDEAIANAFRHGHRSLPDDEPVVVSHEIDARSVRIRVEDRGPGFDPGDVPDPTLDENLSRPSGRGIMLMRAYMTDVLFNQQGNEVTLVYERSDD